MEALLPHATLNQSVTMYARNLQLLHSILLQCLIARTHVVGSSNAYSITPLKVAIKRYFRHHLISESQVPIVDQIQGVSTSTYTCLEAFCGDTVSETLR